jgi:hypothetical protein
MVVEATAAGISASVGLDAQASNWLVQGDGSVAYVDVTTPLLRDPATGRHHLDADVFLASLPWALRGAVRRFLLAEILSHYHELRPALLDLAANLHKERRAEWIPTLLEVIGDRAQLERRDIDRYYRSDARMWALLQHLRRADRWWQRHIRRRRYPFLLPGPIER